jgi:hypothetical protein
VTSNAQRGAYYKARTKQWLERLGYQVAAMEIVRWIPRDGEKPIPVKRDQFASDLLAMNATEIIFVQVKSGRGATPGGTFPEAREKFEAFTFPLSVQRWIVAWPRGARTPRVVKC